MFKYTLDNKRYHTFNYFLKNKFGCKVFKVPLDARASCPNIKNGGCIFCKNSSKSNITNSNLSLKDQYEEETGNSAEGFGFFKFLKWLFELLGWM